MAAKELAEQGVKVMVVEKTTISAAASARWLPDEHAHRPRTGRRSATNSTCRIRKARR